MGVPEFVSNIVIYSVLCVVSHMGTGIVASSPFLPARSTSCAVALGTSAAQSHLPLFGASSSLKAHVSSQDKGGCPRLGSLKRGFCSPSADYSL